MPMAMLLIGAMALVVAIKGNQNEVASRLGSDFLGSGKVLAWVGLIFVIALLGSFLHMGKTSSLLITLVILVYVMLQPSLFGKFESAISGAQAPSPASTQAVGAQTQIPGTQALEAQTPTTPAAQTPAAKGSTKGILSDILGGLGLKI